METDRVQVRASINQYDHDGRAQAGAFRLADRVAPGVKVDLRRIDQSQSTLLKEFDVDSLRP
jgi:hypothetical protein